MRRGILPRACALAAALLLLSSAPADRTVTLTFTGDCTLGSSDATRRWDSSFDSVAESRGTDWFFRRFTVLFAEDDATIINLEGVLSDSTAGAKGRKNFRFRGRTAFARMLPAASVEIAGLANNHAEDYGKQGLADTQSALTEAGVIWIRRLEGTVIEKDGIRVAVYAVDAAGYRREGRQLREEIARVKAAGEADAVVVIAHCGKEYVPRHYAVQTNTAKELIDAGADLVIMHHPHVVQGVEIYRDRTICYSLGNFVFGGNTRIQSKMYYRTHPATSRYGLVVRAVLHFSDDGAYIGQQITLIPVFTSGDASVNDYQPRPVTGDEAAKVMACVQFDTAFALPPCDGSDGRVRLPWLPAEAPDAPEAE